MRRATASAQSDSRAAALEGPLQAAVTKAARSEKPSGACYPSFMISALSLGAHKSRLTVAAGSDCVWFWCRWERLAMNNSRPLPGALSPRPRERVVTRGSHEYKIPAARRPCAGMLTFFPAQATGGSIHRGALNIARCRRHAKCTGNAPLVAACGNRAAPTPVSAVIGYTRRTVYQHCVL